MLKALDHCIQSNIGQSFCMASKKLGWFQVAFGKKSIKMSKKRPCCCCCFSTVVVVVVVVSLQQQQQHQQQGALSFEKMTVPYFKVLEQIESLLYSFS